MAFVKSLLGALRVLAFLVVAFVIGVVLLDQVLMPRYVGYGQEVEVPDVTEKSLKEAQRILEGRGLVLVQEAERYNPDFPTGYIISQDPAPYTWVKRGRRIRVVVSKGSKLTMVPNLMGGISLRQAEILIRSARFKVGTISKEYNPEVPQGLVFFQFPSPGVMVPEGTAIDLTISAGEMPILVEVPDLVGKSLESALTSLKEMGLKPGEIAYEVREELLPETVIGQSVKAGAKVERGSNIDLVVSKIE